MQVNIKKHQEKQQTVSGGDVIKTEDNTSLFKVSDNSFSKVSNSSKQFSDNLNPLMHRRHKPLLYLMKSKVIRYPHDSKLVYSNMPFHAHINHESIFELGEYGPQNLHYPKLPCINFYLAHKFSKIVGLKYLLALVANQPCFNSLILKFSPFLHTYPLDYVSLKDDLMKCLRNLPKNLVSLKRLELSLVYSDITEIGMKHFMIALKGMPRLKFLSLNLCFEHSAKDIWLTYLSCSLARLSGLEFFSLHLHDNLKKEGVISLTNALKFLIKLIGLNLYIRKLETHEFPRRYTIDDILVIFSESLSKLCSLENFSLTIKEGEVKGGASEGFFKLASVIGLLVSKYRLRNLNLSLGLYPSYFRSISSVDYDLLTKIFIKVLILSNLEKVSLNYFPDVTKGDKEKYWGLDYLLEAQSLKKLNMTFKYYGRSGRKINNEDVKYLCSKLCKLIKLEGLGLNFSSSSISNQAVVDLSANLSNLINLKELNLDFSSTIIEDDEVILLGDLLPFLPKLSILQLNLGSLRNANTPYFSSITDNGVNSLSRALSKLVDLTVLKINFSHNTNISEDGFANFIDGLMRLPKLKKLDLNIGDCFSLMDDSKGKLRELSNLIIVEVKGDSSDQELIEYHK